MARVPQARPPRKSKSAEYAGQTYRHLGLGIGYGNHVEREPWHRLPPSGLETRLAMLAWDSPDPVAFLTASHRYAELDEVTARERAEHVLGLCETPRATPIRSISAAADAIERQRRRYNYGA